MNVTLEFKCIDGNIAKYNVVAYCKHKKSFLTKGLEATHNCVERKCKAYIPLFNYLDSLKTGIYVDSIKNK